MSTLMALAGSGLLLLLAALLLPLHKVRQAVLRFAVGAGQSATLALVAMCGAFFVRPNAVPDAVAPVVSPYLAMFGEYVPETFARMPGLPWLVVAAVIVLVALPTLSLVEFAARVVSQTAMLQAFRKELRVLAQAIDHRLSVPEFNRTPAMTADLAAAAEALHSISGGEHPAHVNPAKLVRDLM